MKVLVSVCLLGMPCRYDAKSSAHEGVIALEYDWVAVCPEVAGGLTTPRPAAEILCGRVITKTERMYRSNFYWAPKRRFISLDVWHRAGNFESSLTVVWRRGNL